MKFGYTIMYVENVEQTVEFYEAAFGLSRRFIHEGGYAEMDTGDTTLAFVSLEVAKAAEMPILQPSPDGRAHAVEVAFVTDDVAASFAQAVDAGATVVMIFIIVAMHVPYLNRGRAHRRFSSLSWESPGPVSAVT